MRKSQIASKIFVYMVSLIIMALVLLYGYNAVSRFIDQQKQITFLETKTQAISEIDMIRTSFGSVKELKLKVSGGYEKVCFIDKEDSSPMNRDICNSGNPEYNAIICDSWKEKGAENMFLWETKTAAEGFDVGKIVFDTDNDGTLDGVDTDCSSVCFYICVPVARGQATFWITGLGDKTLISALAPP